jgi:hypothetical protein
MMQRRQRGSRIQKGGESSGRPVGEKKDTDAPKIPAHWHVHQCDAECVANELECVSRTIANNSARGRAAAQLPAARAATASAMPSGSEHLALRRVLGADCFVLIIDRLKDQGSAHDFKSVCRGFRDAIRAYEAEHGCIHTPLTALVGRGNDLLSRPRYYQEMFSRECMTPPPSHFDLFWTAEDAQNLCPDFAVMCTAAQLGDAEIFRVMWSRHWSSDGTYHDPMALFGLGGQLCSAFRCAVYNGIAAGHVEILRACIALNCLQNPDGSMYTKWGYDALAGAGEEMVKAMHQNDLLPPYVSHSGIREKTMALMLQSGASADALDYVHAIGGRYAAGRCDIASAAKSFGLQSLEWLLRKLTRVDPTFFENSMRFASHPDVVWFLFTEKGVRPTADNVRACIEQGADVNFLEKLARRGVLPEGCSLYPALQTSEPRLIRFVLEHSTTTVSQATLRFDEPGHPDDNQPLTCAHAFTDSPPSLEIVELLRARGVPWGNFARQALKARDFQLFRYARDHLGCSFDWAGSAGLFVKAGAPKYILRSESCFVEFLEQVASPTAWETIRTGQVFGFENAGSVF